MKDKQNTSVEITDEFIDRISILAKLELSEIEIEQAKADMKNMLRYIDYLNDVDTEEVDPMLHSYSYSNVFREDVVLNQDGRKNALKNAPGKFEDQYLVPRTFEG